MRFIARRLGFYAVAAFFAVTINFFVPRLVPGNAVEAIMSKFPSLQPGAYKALEALLGVGHPGSLWHQYVVYLGDVVQLKFGTDLAQFPSPVSSVLGAALPWTLVLVGTATVIAFFLGTGLGILSGWRTGGWADQALMGLTFLQALPYFFLALLLITVFSLNLGWLPAAQGYNGAVTQPGLTWSFISNAVWHSLLPALTIVITNVAGWTLQMRNVMITTVAEDYVLAAQAKGLRPRRVVFTYGARNAILPQLSGFANALGFVVSGAIVMEIVFAYPGVGQLLITAVTSNDYPLMQAIFLTITFAVLLANLFVDLVYILVDPRARSRGA
ncbi:MAG TPA: ABC transporter permease [Acidimicrobiales bacterium]|nr:ABC transporter permease [Acidimicrobiales bacterium]